MHCAEQVRILPRPRFWYTEGKAAAWAATGLENQVSERNGVRVLCLPRKEGSGYERSGYERSEVRAERSGYERSDESSSQLVDGYKTRHYAAAVSRLTSDGAAISLFPSP
jgi:hypothetical protein